MQILRTIAACRAFVRAERQQGHTLGFVPTMGALHQGHLQLMQRAKAENDTVLISVFVNPAQFGPGEDYERYPRDLERDAELAASVGVDALFAPTAEEMYPRGFVTHVEQSGETVSVLEGHSRPGHFRGVLTVCAKLFAIVQADRSYFGLKDYQQFLVVRRMARDLDLPTEVLPCPTVREADGLALSSRNQYLDPAARQQAASLFRGLRAAQERLDAGETRAAALADTIRQALLDAGPCRIDYVAVADPDTLAPVETVAAPAIALVAVRIGGTRLIDNLLLTPKG